MRPLIDNDIESELSYAYLHAVAAHAGAACYIAGRGYDGNGIDAILTGWGPFPNGGYLNEITLHIQLKATVGLPVEQNGHYSYYLQGKQRYDDLRTDTVSMPRLLVVLFLPANNAEWLQISAEQLLLKKCAYWVSLRGAGEGNTTGQTVYLPKTQILTGTSLTGIFSTLSHNTPIIYKEP